MTDAIRTAIEGASGRVNVISVRDASPEDAPAIEAVARASWTETYRDIFEPAFIEDFLATNYAADALAAQAERAAAREDAHFGELHRRLQGHVDAYVLDVHSRNERGRVFYERQGFVTVGGGATPDCDLTLQRTLSG